MSCSTPTYCAACNCEGAHPAYGHKSPFCFECEQEWMRSPYRTEAARQRALFIADRRARLGLT